MQAFRQAGRQAAADTGGSGAAPAAASAASSSPLAKQKPETPIPHLYAKGSGHPKDEESAAGAADELEHLTQVGDQLQQVMLTD